MSTHEEDTAKFQTLEIHCRIDHTGIDHFWSRVTNINIYPNPNPAFPATT